MVRHIAVCDDEKNMQRQLSHYLEQYAALHQEDFDVLFYSSGEELLAGSAADPDILLLDISMGGMDGLETAQKLRDRGCRSLLIFITSMEHYAVRGYRVHAFGFLVKPVTYQELSDVLAEAIASLKQDTGSVLPIQTAGGTYLLDISSLLYAEVFQHETSFVLSQEKHTAAIQLGQVEELLTPYGFFRCHRSYLVNLRRIRRIGAAELTLEDGTVIPISKHRRREFIDAYSKWMEVLR